MALPRDPPRQAQLGSYIFPAARTENDELDSLTLDELKAIARELIQGLKKREKRLKELEKRREELKELLKEVKRSESI
jgi:hypothetical protein